jgi:hypothetical protein
MGNPQNRKRKKKRILPSKGSKKFKDGGQPSSQNGRGYFAGLKVTKRNKATVLLTLTLFQTPTLTLILTPTLTLT